MKRHSYEEVVETLRANTSDPFRFGELVDKWNAIFDESEDLPAVQLDASLDGVVDAAADVLASDATGRAISPRLRQVINALPHSAIVVRRDGIVSAMNEAAMGRLPFDPGDSIDSIGINLFEGELLSDAIAASLNRRNAASDVIFRRGLERISERSVTLAIIPSTDHGTAQAMVFIIDPVWRAEIAKFLANAFNLTTSESEVLLTFMDGCGLKEIAARRNTSYATVRTQLQQVMAKTGSRTQAELMRNTIAVSQFYEDINVVAEEARHPHRKRFDLLATGQRSVDVTLSGDFDGSLVIALADATLFTHTAQIEAAFKKAGLCYVALCRPGFGRTDPPANGEDYLDCLANDIRTVIHQLGRKSAVLMGHNTSSVFAYAMAERLEDCLSRIVVKSTLVPGPSLTGQGVRSPWARALMRAVQSSDRMFRVIIFSAIKAWKALGSRRMLMMQLSGFETDILACRDPQVIAEYDKAMKTTLLQGTDYAVLSFSYAAKDWSEWVQRAKVPIELLQGRHDPSSGFDAVQEFATRFASQITLNVIEDAGYMTFLTHTDRTIDVLMGV